jgi:hypothetical protein
LDITNPAIPFGCSVQLSVGPQGPFAETGCHPGGQITQGRRSNLRWNVRSSARLAAVAAAGALVLAACGVGDDDSGGGAGGTASGFNLSTTTIVNLSDRTGGTLKLGAGADCDS